MRCWKRNEIWGGPFARSRPGAGDDSRSSECASSACVGWQVHEDAAGAAARNQRQSSSQQVRGVLVVLFAARCIRIMREVDLISDWSEDVVSAAQ